MNRYFNYLFFILSGGLLLSGCSFRHVIQSKNIVYSPEHKLRLNVFSPKKPGKPKDVLVFIHGGNWNVGKKSTYNFFGKRMAKKEVVTVVIDYRKCPTTYDEISRDVVRSVKWITENITGYGGDTNKIFISGHSAGGHLAALVATDDQYFEEMNMKNPIKGVILIDAFGLDMHKYLLKNDKYKRDVYLSVFTKDTNQWKKASPVYNLHREMPPFMIYVGGSTYPNVTNGNNDFLEVLKRYQPDAKIIIVKGAKHVDMIFSFYNSKKKAYQEIIDFMRREPVLIY
ncbi:MAG: alpha/beta hydrolase [Bacteroidota bacterium]